MAAVDTQGDITAAVTRFLVAQANLGETLQSVAELALAAVDEAAGAGLTLIEGSVRPLSVIAGAHLFSAVEAIQYADGAGPCLDAYRGRSVVRVEDAVATEGHWPGFARIARAVGVGSSLSLPLMAADATYGVLNLYAVGTSGFGDSDVSRARVFATHASVVVDNASAWRAGPHPEADLRAVMSSRSVIEEAKSRLVATGRYTAEEAFEAMVYVSGRADCRLRDVARRIVHAPDLWPDSDPFALDLAHGLGLREPSGSSSAHGLSAASTSALHPSPPEPRGFELSGGRRSRSG